MYRPLLFAAVLSLTGISSVIAGDCGDPDTPCDIEGGSYHIATPQTAAGEQAGIFVFLHGSGGTGAAGIKNQGFVDRVTSRGYALLTPTGLNKDWSVYDGLPDARDDVAFLRDVITDAAQRFDLDPDAVVMTGFSRGASMVWDVACAAPDTATAYAASAGGFWEPMKPTCEAPVHLRHSHGFRDRTVPLEGRQGVWRDQAFHQGNILTGLDIWRETNGCVGAANSSDLEGDRWTKVWDNCDSGSLILQIWDGGHGLPSSWSTDIIDWFETLR